MVSVVPGWLPLVFGYDSQKHHRLATMPDLGGLYYHTDGLNFARVENGFECEKTGVLAFELLPGETDRSQASQAFDKHIQLITQVKGDFQETKETTKELVSQDAAELARGDVLTEDPSHAVSGDNWDAWLQSAEADSLDSKSATCCVDTTPAASVDPTVAETQPLVTEVSTQAHLELQPGSAVAFVNARADVSVRSAPPPPPYTPFAPITSPLEPSLDLSEVGTVEQNRDKKKKKRRRCKKAKHRRCKKAKRPLPSSAASAPDAERRPEKLDTVVEDDDNDTTPARRAVAAALGSRPPTERAKVREDLKSLDEHDSPFAYLSKPAQEPVTRERLQKLHTLTKCTLSLSALRKLLQRANVPNIREALSWYKHIVETCPNKCGLAEYLHRHRLPRTDMPYN